MSVDLTEGVTFETDRELLPLVLRPYRDHCKYMRSAVVAVEPPGRPTVSGDFAIGDSCYIDDTGHFNAVEFNICYNQLAYYLIAKSVKERLIPVLGEWELDDFWRHQLPNILITSFRSRFKQRMRGKRFFGSVSLTDSVRLEKSDRWDPLVVLHTVCRFWDETGGRSSGDVRLAITDSAR
ncbi:fatty acyl CoA thioesterase FcoT [Actinomadura meridiana]|uniref:(2E)-enoyl-[ACP] glycyltransferase n=1 Tax=Actinomadura meridiana TaxID=559626 RepID=A0ABP8BWU3_9ACTN